VAGLSDKLDGVTDPRELVGTIVEQCWSDDAELDRLRLLVTDHHVHRTPMGDWDGDRASACEDWGVFHPAG
jgi:hypothetical protein